MFKTLAQIQAATMSARNKTGDKQIGTRVNAGKFQVIRAMPVGKGKFDIQELSAWISADQAIQKLQSI